MKNLKKVLSLALVFAMVLGLCIGAMAADTQKVTDLTDWDSVTHKEAAQLLNAFNIMQGYTDKTFRPGNNVTRAEAVKMIDVALWGGTDQAERFTGVGETAFSDVKSGDWYAGHVTYAEALGILDGFPDGTLRPNDTVTGYQMLKMALIALNYNSEVEGLTGAGWDIRTMRLATDPSAYNTTTENANKKYDLTAGLEDITNWNAPLTRDQAAQIIYNMIQHSTVNYILTQNGQGGSAKQFSTQSFGQLVLNMGVKSGILYANAEGSMDKTDTPETIAATKGNAIIKEYVPATSTSGTGTYSKTVPYTLDSDLLDLGTPVSLYYKGDTLITATLDGWTEVEPAYDATGAITNFVKDAQDKDVHTPITHGDEDEANYSKTTYIDTNADGLIDIETTVYYNTVSEVKGVVDTTAFGTVYQLTDVAWRASYDKAGTNIASRGFITANEIGAVKGDRIAYTGIANANGSIVNQGVVLSPVDGKVTRVNKNAFGQDVFYIDGDDGHTVTGYNGTGADTGTNKNTVGGQVGFGASGTFYLYPDNTIGWFKGSTIQASVALVYDAGSTSVNASTPLGGNVGSATLTVAAILPDNTKTTFTVASVYNGDTEIKANTVAGINQIIGTNGVLANLNDLKVDAKDATKLAANDSTNYLVKYYLNADGNMVITEKVSTTELTVGKGSADVEVKAGTSILEGNLIVPETVTFVQTKSTVVNDSGVPTSTEDWTVILGSTASYTMNKSGKLAIVTSAYAGSTTKKIDYAIADANNLADSTTTTASTFYYIISNNGQVDLVGGNKVYQVVYFDADANEVKTINTTTKDIAAGTFYTKIDSNGVFSGPFDMAIGNSGKTQQVGYVSSFANNILGLTYVTLPASGPITEANKCFEEHTVAYVTDKDTKFYTINGTDSKALDVADVVAQGAIEPTVVPTYAAGTTTPVTGYKVTVTYGAIVVVGTDNIVDTVIFLEKDASFDAVQYSTTSR